MDSVKQKNQVIKVRHWLGSGSLNIFGMPFAGKDTQGKILAKLLDASLLGGGDIMRGSSMTPRIKSLMRTGELIPTNDYLDIVLPYLHQEQFEDKPMILSSVGRWHGEEAGVLEATAASGHPLRGVIYLDIPEDEIWSRWELAKLKQDRGDRGDDDNETLHIRIVEFNTKTLPVINFYKDEGMLILVDGQTTPQKTTAEIFDRLIEFIS